MEQRIKQIRADKKLTQAEFARDLGVKRNTIAMYETSGRVPAESVIISICRTYHVREEWLRTGEGEMYEETAETIFDQLAAEYDLGPAGKMIVQAALKMYQIGGEKAFVDLVRDILPMMQEIVQQAEARKFSGGDAEQETQSERSGTE
ncbi:MAG: helix-turn-helix transcriptional regulator [Clostridia bacterium]|nr:helix-turn-helix transcriptional regulator [Clostridia bacterium]